MSPAYGRDGGLGQQGQVAVGARDHRQIMWDTHSPFTRRTQHTRQQSRAAGDDGGGRLRGVQQAQRFAVAHLWAERYGPHPVGCDRQSTVAHPLAVALQTMPGGVQAWIARDDGNGVMSQTGQMMHRITHALRMVDHDTVQMVRRIAVDQHDGEIHGPHDRQQVRIGFGRTGNHQTVDTTLLKPL